MRKVYNFAYIEKKWQRYWEENKTFEVHEDDSIPTEKRKYILDMFPYPSAAGLHVGHPEGYTASDIYARFLRMNGYHVLHPMGFDSFGLPAENYAIKTKTHPRITTEKNIEQFRKQIKQLGFSYDWNREVSTHSPEYYCWTQWIFLQIYEKGLAYQKKMPVWFCPNLGTVLANEEVLTTDDGPRSERGKHPVERRHLTQWMLKITEYADRLLDDLDLLDWPDSIKVMQRNWIGKSEGVEISFPIINFDTSLFVFTTRPDTLWGATYMVVSPEHPILDTIVPSSYIQQVKDYKLHASKKSDFERSELNKEKTGVFTGAYALNPVTKQKIPIWTSDYVLMEYGTGAIMAVPAHDDRDWDFAKKFNIPIVQVVVKQNTDSKEDLQEAYVGEGVLINSDQFSGTHTKQARKDIIAWLQKKSFGTIKTQYKLRDWIFSRQRYWGEPIPILKTSNNEIISLSEEDLPLTLPQVESYSPTGTGESPLATIKEWCTVSLANGEVVKRETHTMPQWAGSCWYYIRFTDPKNKKYLASKENIDYWLPVDLYIGGAEHAVLHLLYARFWHKVLYDIGVVNTKEPFQKLVNQGMILGEDGNKMSKSLGNVINPDDIVEQYGADSLRLYEMFMGPLRQEKPWSTNGLKGIYRFLLKLCGIADKPLSTEKVPQKLVKILHQSIKKIGEDTNNFLFNTAISQMMILSNEMNHYNVRYKEVWKSFILLLAPYAPHLAEELWEELGHKNTLAYEMWPQYQEELTRDTEIELVVQINGKIRAKTKVLSDTDRAQLQSIALSLEPIQELLKDKNPKKIIVVPNKLVNIVC